MNDLKLAFRQIARSPGFTLAVTLSLALGIGANATVLCWLRQLVLRPLPGVTTQAELLPAAIALLACWVPARRATRVDPIKALRTE